MCFFAFCLYFDFCILCTFLYLLNLYQFHFFELFFAFFESAWTLGWSFPEGSGYNASPISFFFTFLRFLRCNRVFWKLQLYLFFRLVSGGPYLPLPELHHLRRGFGNRRTQNLGIAKIGLMPPPPAPHFWHTGGFDDKKCVNSTRDNLQQSAWINIFWSEHLFWGKCLGIW